MIQKTLREDAQSLTQRSATAHVVRLCRARGSLAAKAAARQRENVPKHILFLEEERIINGNSKI